MFRQLIVENNIIPRGRVLEIGCGNGRNAIYLAKNGFSVTAVDLSQEAISWATQQATLQNGYSKEKLKAIFKSFEEIKIRDMLHNNLRQDEFGLEDFIVCLFKK